MSQDYVRSKSFKSFGLESPNRYEVDLLNEVQKMDFGQGAAKISEVKVGGQKKISHTGQIEDYINEIFVATRPILVV